MPPETRVNTVLLCIFRKLYFLSLIGAVASRNTATADTLRVLTAKAWSRLPVSGRLTAISIIVMLTAQTMAVAKAEATPVTKNFFCSSLVLVFFSFRLRSHDSKDYHDGSENHM